MGLDDGEPICPDAIHLTDRSRRKIRNIAFARCRRLKAFLSLSLTKRPNELEYLSPASFSILVLYLLA
jgi:hypothetical protein